MTPPRRIPTAFVRDPETGLVIDRLAPGSEWVSGAVRATRKWDGDPILLSADGCFARGIKLAPGEDPPSDRFRVEIEHPDGHRFGWSGLSMSDPADAPYVAAVRRYCEAPGALIGFGEYEAIGPGIKCNAEGLDQPTLVRHDALCYLFCPTDLEALVYFLAEHRIEGIVWRSGENMAQLTRTDVGLDWPPTIS